MSENSDNNAPAHQQAPKGDKATQLHCKCCGAAFTPRKRWQVFCSPKCKKDYEQIIHAFSADIREAATSMAEKLVELRIKTGD